MNELIEYLPFRIFLEVLIFFLGASVGSFLKCLSDRYGTEDKEKRSHCDSCGSILKPYELIPIFSYIFLKGRCKNCGEKIGISSLVCEILSAISYLAIYLRFGFKLETIFGFVIYGILFAASLIDLRLMIIPNIFSIGLIIVCFLNFLITSNSLSLISVLLGGLLLPGIILLISLILGKIIKKEAMGMGDIKILIGTGLLLGLEKSLINIFLMSVVGITWSIISKKKQEAFPLMPSIFISTMVSYLFGDAIVKLYINIL